MSNDAPTKTIAESSSAATVADSSAAQTKSFAALNGRESASLELDERCRVGDEIKSAHILKTDGDVQYCRYVDERQMPAIMTLMSKDLSEPYSIYTYRYFICQWPHLSFLAVCDGHYMGAIVCKLDQHSRGVNRGYIAMLTVDKAYRRRRVGTTLVCLALDAMSSQRCDEVVLETEVSNQNALSLYERLGFCRDKRLVRYYLNDVDALRLKLWLT